MSKYEGTVLRCHFSIDERRSNRAVAVAAFKRQETERGSRCFFSVSRHPSPQEKAHGQPSSYGVSRMPTVGETIALADAKRRGPSRKPATEPGASPLPSQPPSWQRSGGGRQWPGLCPQMLLMGQLLPARGHRLLEEAAWRQVSPETVGAVDQGGPRGGGGNGDRSRPCGPSACRQSRACGEAVPLAHRTQPLCWDQAPGPQGNRHLIVPGLPRGCRGSRRGWCLHERPPPSGRTHGVCSREAGLGAGGRKGRPGSRGGRGRWGDREDGEPGVLRPLRQHLEVHHSLCTQVCFCKFSNNVMDQNTRVSWVRRVPVGLAGAPAGKPESPADEPLGPTPRTPLTFKHRTRNCLHILVSFQRTALSPVSYPWVQKVTHRPLAHM